MNWKAFNIIMVIRDYVNGGEDRYIRLERDGGGNELTIVSDQGHTHVGFPGASDNELINHLYGVLVKHCGLSWYKDN